MPATVVPRKDDRLTLIAISALGCILQDVLHEGLGHGVTAWLSGAHRVTMSTVALQSDIETGLISTAGTIVNLVFAGIFWLLLLRPQRYRPATRYFLVLAMAGNLFTGTGYFLFSGVFNFGDWAAVIRVLQPHWAWQLGLAVLGLVSYYGAVLVVAKVAAFQTFQENDNSSRRLRDLCRDFGWPCSIVQPVRAVLHDRVGVAFDISRKFRAIEPARDDSRSET